MRENVEVRDGSPSGIRMYGTAAAIVVVGVLARLALAWHTAANGSGGRYFSRGVELGFVARSIAAGAGFRCPFGVETGPTAYLAPGYPAVVGEIFRVFGTFSTQAAVAVMVLQTVFAAVTLVLIVRIGRSTVGGSAGTMAAMFWAVSPVAAALATLFWETSCSAMLLTGMMALALKGTAESRWPYWAGLGGGCAATGLVNPALLPTVILVVGWVAWRTRAPWGRLALALLIMTLLYLPWPVRNARVLHAVVPFRSNLGLELWEGNREGGNGHFDDRLHPYLNSAELKAYRTMGEMNYMRRKSGVAKAYIGAHPGEIALVTLKRCGRFWLGLEQPSDRISWIVVAHVTGTSVLGLAGWILLFRRDQAVALLFALPLLVFPLPYYVTHADARFRLLLDPLLSVLAAHALVRGWRAVQGRLQRRSLKAQSEVHV